MDFNEARFLFRPKHLSGVVPAGTTAHLYLKITGSNWKLGGLDVIVDNSAISDTIGLAVEDKDGIAYPAGTTLVSYTSSWFIDPNTKKLTVEPGYLSDLMPQNTYIRLSYNATGTSDVSVRANLHVHEVKPT